MKLLRYVFFLLVATSGFAQTPGYNIHFKVDGLKDTTAYLGYYYGENTYIRDTAKVNSKGEFTFNAKKRLDQGSYFLVLDKTRLFEFVVGSNQNFTLETSTADYIKHMIVKNDVDNKIFFDNIFFNMDRHKEAEPFMKIIQDSTLAEDKKKDARQGFSKINEKVMAYQDEIIAKYPSTVTAKIMKSTKAVKIPDPPKRPDGSIDSTFQLRWYREHFFDYFDLSDDVLIRMPRPVYTEKVKEYLDRLFVPQRDTVTNAIKKIVAKAKPNKETYKYLVWSLLSKYQTQEIMGMEEVFVDLYDLYFANGEMDYWIDAKTKKNLKEYADRIRLSMLGKTAPDLIMKDPNEKLLSLYALKNKYTIVLFFDPDCGHCRTEIPKLVDFYTKDKTRFNLEVFSVSTDSSMTKLKKFIKEMKMTWPTVNFYYSAVGHYQQLYDAPTTPTIFVLDERKKIIGKKIPVEKMEEFLLNYEKFQKSKAVKKA